MEEKTKRSPFKKIPKYYTISRHLFATFAIFLPHQKLSNFPRIRKLWIQRALKRFCCYIYFSKRMLYSFEKKIQNKLQ